MKKYELMDHTADLGLRIFGKNHCELFQNAGYALFDVITDISQVSPRKKRSFQLQRDSIEELLVEWLNALLYVFDTELFLFGSFLVSRIDNSRLIAEAEGECLNPAVHTIKTGIKAVTYHNLKIYKNKGGWQATVVLDI